MAFSSRTHGEYQTLTAPARTPFMVMTALTAERASSGSFSTTSQESFLGGIAVWTAGPESDSCAEANIRRNGQKAHNSRTHGKVTTCGPARKPSAHTNATARYLPILGSRAYQRYAPKASRNNNMLSGFLRSAIQATDSTLMGCSANSAATIKLRPA